MQIAKSMINCCFNFQRERFNIKNYRSKLNRRLSIVMCTSNPVLMLAKIQESEFNLKKTCFRIQSVKTERYYWDTQPSIHPSPRSGCKPKTVIARQLKFSRTGTQEAVNLHTFRVYLSCVCSVNRPKFKFILVQYKQFIFRAPHVS